MPKPNTRSATLEDNQRGVPNASLSAPADSDDRLVVQLTANNLRALAEAADGVRKRKAYIVHNPGDPDNPLRVAEKPGTTTIVIELLTEDNQKPRKHVVLDSTPKLKPTMPPPNQEGKEITIKDADAVFTSLSAVEKFLVPYYSHMKPLDQVVAMREKFAASEVETAAFHLPSSYEGLAVAGGIVFATATPDGLEPKSFEQFIELR
jgi:hypothetical protein